MTKTPDGTYEVTIKDGILSIEDLSGPMTYDTIRIAKDSASNLAGVIFGTVLADDIEAGLKKLVGER